jgi:hypothetical protein
MGQDSYASHVLGKKHLQKVAQMTYANRNKAIAEEENATASRSSSQVRAQPVWKDDKSLQPPPTTSAADPRSLASVERDSYSGSRRFPSSAGGSRGDMAEYAEASDYVREPGELQEPPRFERPSKSGRVGNREAPNKTSNPAPSTRTRNSNALRVDPREKLSYSAADPYSGPRASDSRSVPEFENRRSRASEHRSSYLDDVDDRKTESRQNVASRLSNEPRTYAGSRRSDRRHTSNAEVSTSEAFSARSKQSGEVHDEWVFSKEHLPSNLASSDIGTFGRMPSPNFQSSPHVDRLESAKTGDHIVSDNTSRDLGSRFREANPIADKIDNSMSEQSWPARDFGDQERDVQGSMIFPDMPIGRQPEDGAHGYSAAPHLSGQVLTRETTYSARQMDAPSSFDAWLDEPMSVDEWRALEDMFMDVGGDHALAFKILREALLNPHVGMDEHDLETCMHIFNRIPLTYEGNNLWSTKAAHAPRCTIFESGQQSVSSQEEVDALQRLGTLIRSHLDPFHRDAAEEVPLFIERSSDEREAEYQALFDAKANEANKQGGFVSGQTAIVLYNMNGGQPIPSSVFHPKSVVCDPTFLSLQSPEVKDMLLNKISRSR